MSLTIPIHRVYDPVNHTFMPPYETGQKYGKTCEEWSDMMRAQYQPEIASPNSLKAIHGLDAEAELASILSSEIFKEINNGIWEMKLFRRENPLDFLFDEEAAEAELDRQLQAQPEFLFRSRKVDPNLQWMIGYDGTTEEDDYEEAT